jgi:hypothetical protein
MRQIQNAYRIFVCKSEAKRQLWKPMFNWDDGIKIYLKDLVWNNLARNMIYLLAIVSMLMALMLHKWRGIP